MDMPAVTTPSSSSSSSSSTRSRPAAEEKQPAQAKTAAAATVDLVLFDRHDIFNLVALPIVIVANSLFFATTFKLHFLGDGPHGSLPIFENVSLSAATWVFSLNYWIFQTYVLVDTIWLVLYPQSVPSAPAIIYHHLGVLVGWNCPVFDQYWAFWASLAAMIEVNTFFLILKRQHGKNVWIVHALFYITWVLMRNVVYPLCLYFYSLDYYFHSMREYGSLANSGAALELLLIFLNFLNFQWTYDLVRKMVRGGGQMSKTKGAL